MKTIILKRLNGTKVVYEDDGEYFTNTIFLRVRKDASRLEVFKECERVYATHCKHSYDCCGNFYARVYRKNIRRVKRGEYAVTLQYVQNI